MISFVAFTFLIITSMAAFVVRGVWGHQVGGWVMGVSTTIAVGIVLGLDLAKIGVLSFWSAFAWALASFVGWANHGAKQRFLRGMLAYGMLPGAVMGIILIPGVPFAWITAMLVIGLPTGAAFALSSVLIPLLATRDRKHGTSRAWRNGMEYPTGLLHGAGIALFITFSITMSWLPAPLVPAEWTWYHVVPMAISCGCIVPACIAKTMSHRQRQAKAMARDASARIQAHHITHPLVLVVIVSIVVIQLVLLVTSIVLDRAAILFNTQMLVTGVIASKHEDLPTASSKQDLGIAWIAIAASAVLAWLV